MIEWNSRSRMAATTAPGTTPAVATADDDLGVVFARDLERERARELAEERPLDLEHALRRVDFVAAWRHVRFREGWVRKVTREAGEREALRFAVARLPNVV